MAAVSVVASIFLLIGVGMALTHAGWLDEAGAKLVARLTVDVGMFSLVISNMLTEFTRERLLASAGGIAASYLSMGLTVALGLIVARLLKIEGNRRGVFTCMFAFSNSVFIGVPVSVGLFGDGAMPYALLYYVANTSLFWSVGCFLMARDGGRRGKIEIRKLFPMPFVAFLLSVALILMGWTLPAFAMRAAKYLGALVTPLSLIYTGYVIMRMIKRGSLKWHGGYAAMLIGRFVLSPALLLLAVIVTPVDAFTRNVLLIQAAMPVMTQTTIAAGDRGADVEYAAGGLLLSTLLSLLLIPAYMALIPYLN